MKTVRPLLAGALALAALAVLGLFLWQRAMPPSPPPPAPPKPSPLAIWPWPHAAKDTPHPGVTHWLDTSSPDGTVLDFFDFDFQTNPHLRFEIYDQDQDDAHPFDDFADCWPHGVGWATQHLNATGRGQVVAAWHGLFFNCDNAPGKSSAPNAAYVGHHVTPVVLNGQVRCNVGQARWTFGAQYDAQGHPTFKTLLMPDRAALAKNFTYASGGAQCLIKDGLPLKLHPWPNMEDPAPRQPVPCGPDEAGYIPNVDWIQTSRATTGWSRDGKHFYLLFVTQTGDETGSVMASRGHGPPTGGWTVTDEQRFWLAQGAWGAINSDGGDVAQLTYLRSDGNYFLLPPVPGGSPQQRLVVPPTFPNAPPGGTLLYLFVRDTGSRLGTHPADKSATLPPLLAEPRQRVQRKGEERD